MSQTKAVLHGFSASSCTWRARAALRVKGVPFQELDVDIVKKRGQLTEEYLRVNPMQKVPALEIDGVTIVESMAILQYLDETRPLPNLQPKTSIERMRMREICEVIVSGMQPLQNIGLITHFPSQEAYLAFSKHWSARGLLSLETLLAKSSSGRYCAGDQLSMADLCLVPQVNSAVNRLLERVYATELRHNGSAHGFRLSALRVSGAGTSVVGPELKFKMSIADYPTVSKLYNSLLEEDALKSTSPSAIRPHRRVDGVIKN